MPSDLFRQLSEREIPPVPAELERSVHTEVNRWLLTAHLSELLLRGLPWVAWNLGRAIVSFFFFTLSGKFSTETKRR